MRAAITIRISAPLTLANRLVTAISAGFAPVVRSNIGPSSTAPAERTYSGFHGTF
jgi:hypothetical protein